MHKIILTLLALLFSVTGCSFTLSSHGGWGSDGPAPLMASRGHGWASAADPGLHGRGKPARRVDASERPATKPAGATPTKAKQPGIQWAGEVPQKAKQPGIKWAGEVPPKAKQPAITWAGKVPPKRAKQPRKPAGEQPAITWAGTVPPRPQ